MKKILIVGKEPRQKELYKLLTEKGYEVILEQNMTKELNDKADAYFLEIGIVLFPVPAKECKEWVAHIGEWLPENVKVFGTFSNEEKEMLRERKVACYSYTDSNEIAFLNAIATAEGAISYAIMNSSINLFQSKVLVTGFGRCGKVLANKLSALGAKVTVYARREEPCAEAVALGNRAVNSLEKIDFSQMDYIFNTVPANLLEHVLDGARLKSHLTIIDIASRGPWINSELIERNNLSYHLCLGIPGKYAPKSSAEILIKVIEEKMGD